MKNIFILLTTTFLVITFSAQTYPLRTYGIKYPANSYVQDTNNELLPFVGNWSGTWKNKTIYLYFKKIKYYANYLGDRAYYADIIVGNFKVIDNSTGQILFDNTSLPDNEILIEGMKFKQNTNRYILSYNDPSLCLSAFLYIRLTDPSNTKLEFQLSEIPGVIDKNCPYYNAPEMPEPLPKNIILTKQ
ncbi:DUF6705 family protein [Elizabethkingia ursingii]|uniref:DUF6705 family protein n=1 Tax=Elizabethkingia ursingii TaxID=1756150 RepID=UPI000B18506B|nr:DUF6705 family protein [Elizabethkingia ursingii]